MIDETNEFISGIGNFLHEETLYSSCFKKVGGDVYLGLYSNIDSKLCIYSVLFFDVHFLSKLIEFENVEILHRIEKLSILKQIELENFRMNISILIEGKVSISKIIFKKFCYFKKILPVISKKS
jgi:hypothetical protein